MATKDTLVYKYPKLIKMVEDNVSINSCYVNPHADLIDYVRNDAIKFHMFLQRPIDSYENVFAHFNDYIRHDKINTRMFSQHPSNAAVRMMLENHRLINIAGLLSNPNPNIGPLLRIVKSSIEAEHCSHMSCSHNPAILKFLEENPSYIDWYSLSGNECDDAIRILQNNPDKIVWWIFSSNSSALEIIKKNMDKVDKQSICKNKNPAAMEIIEQILAAEPSYMEIVSENPNAMHIINRNVEIVDGFYLSRNPNPNAIELLMKHPELIDFRNIMLNPSAIPYLETQMEQLAQSDMHALTENPNCIPLIQKLFDADMITDEYKSDIARRIFHMKSLYELDYQTMSKIRSKLLYPEIIEKAFHPARVAKWLDYHCENGGSVDDFDM